MSTVRSLMVVLLIAALARPSVAHEASADTAAADSAAVANKPAGQREKKQAPPLPTPTAANLSYGPHPKQVLDFWKAATGVTSE